MTESKEGPVLSNGDCFDEDSGEYLACLTYPALEENTDIAFPEVEMRLPPANISVYIDGYWYNYKMDSKVNAMEKQNAAKEI